jgi:hypothetical protein
MEPKGLRHIARRVALGVGTLSLFISTTVASGRVAWAATPGETVVTGVHANPAANMVSGSVTSTGWRKQNITLHWYWINPNGVQIGAKTSTCSSTTFCNRGPGTVYVVWEDVCPVPGTYTLVAWAVGKLDGKSNTAEGTTEVNFGPVVPACSGATSS